MSRVGSLWLLAVSIGAFFCFCVGSGMLISGSTAAPFSRPAIANQSIPPFDRPRGTALLVSGAAEGRHQVGPEKQMPLPCEVPCARAG